METRKHIFMFARILKTNLEMFHKEKRNSYQIYQKTLLVTTIASNNPLNEV